MPEGEGFARRVTLRNLAQFAPLLSQRSTAGTPDQEENEEEAQDSGEASEGVAADTEVAAAEALFQGESITVSVDHRRPSRTREQGGSSSSSRRPVIEVPGLVHSGRGELFWTKPSLPPSDVQRQPGNPTGGVRLAQAGFRNQQGAVIDQIRYFREEVFGSLDWVTGQEVPFREDAYAEFKVTLRGTDYGRHRMRISHKPSGEAGQGNYTTMLHWGELGDTVRDLDLRGLPLSLYGPPAGETEPYFLEVG